MGEEFVLVQMLRLSRETFQCLMKCHWLSTWISTSFPGGGQCTKQNISLCLGSVAAKTFYCKCHFCYLEGFLVFNLSKTERQVWMHSANLSELQERLFWWEQNNLALLFVGLWSVEMLRKQLQWRNQCFKLTFFLPLGDLPAKTCDIGFIFCPCHVINHSRIISVSAVYLLIMALA